MGNLVDPASS